MQEFKYLNGHTESEPNPDYLKKRQNNDFDKMFQLDRGETDKTHARKALKQLATSEPNYMRALCHMLLIDYICLPMYPLPPPCSFLQSLRDKAVQAMEVNSEVPPHI